eukprot:6347797-Amphidinium_carterae.1
MLYWTCVAVAGRVQPTIGTKRDQADWAQPIPTSTTASWQDDTRLTVVSTYPCLERPRQPQQ